MKWLALGRVGSNLVLEADERITEAQLRAFCAKRVPHGEGTSCLVVTRTDPGAIESVRLRASAAGLELSEKNDRGEWSPWRNAR